MELFHFVLFIVIAGAVAQEPTTEIYIPEVRVQQNSEAKVICTVKNADTDTLLKIQKFVEIKNPETKVYEELVATNTVVENRYKNTGRFEIEALDKGADVEYTLTIKDTQREDSAVYACTILGTAAHSSKLLEIYTKPSYVHFMNSTMSHVKKEEKDGKVITALHFEEDETYDLGCMAMGGVPNPTIEVTVGEDNYTRAFLQHDTEVVLPDCYDEGSIDGCFLHLSSESSISADNFRPYYTADGQDMECKAYVDHENPVTARLSISMKYKPKFHCWKKHKVAVHERNYELTCTVLANPQLRNAHVEFMWNDQKVTLNPGEQTEDGEIKFLNLKVTSNKETDAVLKFEEIFERHYDLKFTLFAESEFGDNSTTLELVDETYVRGSADVVMYNGILALFTCILSFFMS